MQKESIFRRPPERKSEGDYFLDAFPDMPDKAGLYDAMDAISFMSDDAFIYYLPFLMECLLEDPYPYDRLSIIVEGRLTRIAPESEEKYKSELALARQQMAEVNKTFY